MLAGEILTYPLRVLSKEQRDFYFAQGYLLVEKLIDDDCLDRLRTVTDEFVERGRSTVMTNTAFDIAPGHCPEQPRLRRLNTPDQCHPTYWEFATGIIADLAADLVGPNVTFHHSKLNFKWSEGADGVDWHQDICFYPHSNYSPLTIGTYLADTKSNHGPVAVIAGSHEGPLYDHYDSDSDWAGRLSDSDVARLDLSEVKYLSGPAGSITVHNCRTIHGSRPSDAGDGRPLLLNAYASADATAYSALDPPARSFHSGEIVRGVLPVQAHVDPRPCAMPPDWSDGNTSIYANQSGAHKIIRPDV